MKVLVLVINVALAYTDVPLLRRRRVHTDVPLLRRRRVLGRRVLRRRRRRRRRRRSSFASLSFRACQLNGNDGGFLFFEVSSSPTMHTTPLRAFWS